MVRRGLALVGALSLVLSPGAVGLVRAFASLDTCGCNMGPDCPMCKARRANEKKEATCPCRWQRRGTGGERISAEAPSLEPACLPGLSLALDESPLGVSLETAAFEPAWLPDVPHPPPRA
ncbi:MAG: hypothetical protein ACYDCL_15375 [Myxococcales bacterium]